MNKKNNPYKIPKDELHQVVKTEIFSSGYQYHKKPVIVVTTDIRKKDENGDKNNLFMYLQLSNGTEISPVEIAIEKKFKGERRYKTMFELPENIKKGDIGFLRTIDNKLNKPIKLDISMPKPLIILGFKMPMQDLANVKQNAVKLFG